MSVRRNFCREISPQKGPLGGKGPLQGERAPHTARNAPHVAKEDIIREPPHPPILEKIFPVLRANAYYCTPPPPP